MLLVGEVLETSSSCASGSFSRRTPPEARRLLAIKGAGESLGLPCLSTRPSLGGNPSASALSAGCGGVPAAEWGARLQSLRWACYARARGAVTVFTARASDLQKLVDAHPEMERAVKQIVIQQETDLMVAEAMRQLRLVSECEHLQVPSVMVATKSG